MSGGSLNYFYSDLADHTKDFDDVELNDLVSDLTDLFHAREWYLSGDTCEGKWNDARDAFKQKWFTHDGRQTRVEQYIAALQEKLMKAFGLSDRYCRNCGNWTPYSKENYEEYGDCCLIKGCLMHRSESCDKFQERDSWRNDDVAKKD